MDMKTVNDILIVIDAAGFIASLVMLKDAFKTKSAWGVRISTTGAVMTLTAMGGILFKTFY